jgi:hypothetical protein
MRNSDRIVTKRRANAARLLACLLPIVALGAFTASASAAPPTPKLVVTNPASSESAPATSTIPAILGEAEPEDGIIIERAPFFGVADFGPVVNTVEKPTENPDYEIQIFDAPECQGTLYAVGTAEALEQGGILVGVAANSKTSFSALQVNPAEPGDPSGCSNVLSYWEGSVASGDGGSGGGGSGEGGSTGAEGGGSGGSTSGGSSSGGSPSGGKVGGANPAGPKPDAPNLHLVPGERADDLTPLVAGSAHGAESVTVYANANCSGSPVAKGSPAQLAAGFEVSVPVNTATTFSAVAVAAQHSGCSDPVTYTEDSTAPRTRITMGPGVKTRKRKAVFRFTDVTEDPPGTTFVCKVDKKKWKPCSSPFHLKHLKLGHYLVSIRATDVAGNVERKPVKRRFIVVPPAGR